MTDLNEAGRSAGTTTNEVPPAGQWTREELKNKTPSEIVAAYETGQLDDLMAGQGQ